MQVPEVDLICKTNAYFDLFQKFVRNHVIKDYKVSPAATQAFLIDKNFAVMEIGCFAFAL